VAAPFIEQVGFAGRAVSSDGLQVAIGCNTLVAKNVAAG
jgi:hypothetical protein